MHTSIPLGQSIELINITPINPLISKCQIKVCYVSDEPNRNRSIINKETGKKLANSIPGSPIVGFYNETKEDFEGHNKVIDISGGEFKIKDTTRPYGFVDLNAKVWFQKFMDDGVEHEYLMTEGFLWTGQYPECKRILDKGNNQSMELDEYTLDANWTKNEKGNPEFFIINEAIMSKLCILGEDVEPCFEGANITKIQFSFDEDVKQSWFSFMEQMKEILNEGGKPVFNKYDVNIGDALWIAVDSYSNDQYYISGIFEDENTKFAVLKSKDQDNYYRLDFSFENDVLSPAGELADITDTFSAEMAHFSVQDNLDFKKKKDEENEDGKKSEQKPAEESKSAEEDSKEDEDGENEEDEKKKNKGKGNGNGCKYELNDIPEYVNLLQQYEQLKTDYAALQATNETLTQFKKDVEREKKMKMINVDFCMLDEELKKDVIENVDSYSLDEIEAKLSIICVRNKVSFNLDDNSVKQPTTFNLDGVDESDSGIPAWVIAAREVAKTLND